MKIRTAFVSNSSSASFIIYWKALSEDKLSKSEALEDLFRYSGRDLTELIVRTIEVDDKNTESNEYVTIFDTGCLNSPDDFGEDAAALLFNLYINKEDEQKYELIKTKLMRD